MIDYKTFMRHAAKVCSSSHLVEEIDRYKILKGVLHHENGSLICTDAHRLYIAKNMHSRTDKAVITPKGKVLEGNYPNVDRIVPDKLNANQEIEVVVRDLLKGVDIIHSVAKLNDGLEKVLVRFEDGRLFHKHPVLSANYEIGFSFQYPMTFNAEYLLDALKLFKAAKCEFVNLYYYGSMRPLIIENESSDLLALILPVRTH